MRPRLNCWLVAMYLWAASRAKGYAWVRRSKSFWGAIPHFGYAEETTHHLIVIEYVPPVGRRWTHENKVILFRGTYKVSILQKTFGAEFRTLRAATDWATTAVTASVRSSGLSSEQGFCSRCGRSSNDTR